MQIIVVTTCLLVVTCSIVQAFPYRYHEHHNLFNIPNLELKFPKEQFTPEFREYGWKDYHFQSSNDVMPTIKQLPNLYVPLHKDNAPMLALDGPNTDTDPWGDEYPQTETRYVRSTGRKKRSLQSTEDNSNTRGQKDNSLIQYLGFVLKSSNPDDPEFGYGSRPVQYVRPYRANNRAYWPTVKRFVFPSVTPRVLAYKAFEVPDTPYETKRWQDVPDPKMSIQLINNIYPDKGAQVRQTLNGAEPPAPDAFAGGPGRSPKDSINIRLQAFEFRPKKCPQTTEHDITMDAKPCVPDEESEIKAENAVDESVNAIVERGEEMTTTAADATGDLDDGFARTNSLSNSDDENSTEFDTDSQTTDESTTVLDFTNTALAEDQTTQTPDDETIPELVTIPPQDDPDSYTNTLFGLFDKGARFNSLEENYS